MKADAEADARANAAASADEEIDLDGGAGPGGPPRGAGDGDHGDDAPSWTVASVLFHAFWFGLVPLLVAQLRGFLLSALPSSPIVETLRGQPIPVSIVLYTIAAMLLWSQRWSLAGASAAGIGGRPGLSADVRRRFDQARALQDEARAILRAHAREIERSMRKETRDEIEKALAALTASMHAETFDEQRFETALENASRIVDERLGRWRRSELREYVESIVFAVLVAFGIRIFVIEAFKIPSSSMVPTLLVGDHIFVNKLAYGPEIPFTNKRIADSMPPKRGDVIVFKFPEDLDEDFIKRVIALPGDKLEVKNKRVFVNDKPIPRCFVGHTAYVDVPEQGPVLQGAAGMQEGDLYVEINGPQRYFTFYATNAYARENSGPWYPKPGEVYVLGDNRNNSRDSREWWNGKGGGVPFDYIKGRALWIWLSFSGDGYKSERIGSSVMGTPRLPAAMQNLQKQLDVCMGPNPPLDLSGLDGGAPGTKQLIVP